MILRTMATDNGIGKGVGVSVLYLGRAQVRFTGVPVG